MPVLKNGISKVNNFENREIKIAFKPKIFWLANNLYLFYIIYKENYLFQHFWAEFFFPKIPSIFNTNVTNTIWIYNFFFPLSFKKCNKLDEYIYGENLGTIL